MHGRGCVSEVVLERLCEGRHESEYRARGDDSTWRRAVCCPTLTLTITSTLTLTPALTLPGSLELHGNVQRLGTRSKR